MIDVNVQRFVHFRQGLDGSAEDSGICWIRCNFTDDSLRLLYVIVFVCDRDLLKNVSCHIAH